MRSHTDPGYTRAEFYQLGRVFFLTVGHAIAKAVLPQVVHADAAELQPQARPSSSWFPRFSLVHVQVHVSFFAELCLRYC